MYETEQFAVSEKKLHLMRDRYSYKEIDFDKVNSIIIRKGKDLRNWLRVLIVGLGLLAYVIYDIIKVFPLFYDHLELVIYIERLSYTLLPFMLGIYSLIVSLRTTMVMIVYAGSRKYHFSLRHLIKTNKYADFKVSIKNIFPVIKIND